MAEKMDTYYTVHRIDEHTWHIEDYFHDYMYLVEGSKKAAVIDTGMGFRGLRSVVEKLTDRSVMVLNTHGHLDHIGANGEFDEVYIHKADELLMREHAAQNYRNKDIPQYVREVGAVLPESVIRDLICIQSDYEAKPLIGGQEIDLGGRILKVLEVPGHTQGSVMFMDEDSSMLFSGDMMCTLGIMLSFECSSTVSKFIESLKGLKREVSGKINAVYPGHHVFPISPLYFDKYIACAEQLLKSREGSVVERGVFGNYYRFPYEDISLTYVDKTCK